MKYHANKPDEVKTLINNLIQSITAQFKISKGRPDRVKADCAQLRKYVKGHMAEADIEISRQLPPLLLKRTGPIAIPLFSLLEEVAANSHQPWPILNGLLTARDKNLATRALKSTVKLAESGSLLVDSQIISFFARQLETESNPFIGKEALNNIARILHCSPFGKSNLSNEPELAIFLESKDLKHRGLAARLLDRFNQPVTRELVIQLLGRKNQSFFAPYLAYTRATYMDMFCLQPLTDKSPSALQSFQRVEKICGDKLLKEIIATLGWSRVNFGIQAHRLIGISINGSLPLMLLENEAILFERCKETRRTSDIFLIVANGGSPADKQHDSVGQDRVALFRAYNLLHAELLKEILDVAQLTRERVQNIICLMDRIVENFIVLFSVYTEECLILPDIYQELKKRILSELKLKPRQTKLSAEADRLVKAFEDPGSIGEVQTFHGLKRYLHQLGLALGFHFVEKGSSPNRTVDIITSTHEKILTVTKVIQYADFESDPDLSESTLQIPYPVQVVIDGYSRQIMHGQKNFPNTKIFCYGNEVHYYLNFKNHPAFIRIDYSPPVRGGMIDLKYFGVSNYELSIHPNTSLEAIRIFFQLLDFDIQIDGTHIHARYDKERALDLGDLRNKVEALFRLAPYIMDIDWIIGSLKLDKEAQLKVAEAWAESFIYWGVLPVDQLITKNRTGIIKAMETGPSAKGEVGWSGKGDYSDLFNVTPPTNFFKKLYVILEQLGVETLPFLSKDCRRPMGQIRLERLILTSLRKAMAYGAIIPTPDGYQATHTELFQRIYAPDCFTKICASGENAVVSVITMARLAAPLESTLKFRTTGSVNGYEVQYAAFPLKEKNMSLYVLRGAKGIIRLALFAHDEVLFKRRKNTNLPWIPNTSSNVNEFTSLLRNNNYLDPGPEQSVDEEKNEARNFLKSIQEMSMPEKSAPLPGERIITGLKASPGRSVGKVLFNTSGRKPEDFKDAILISPSIKPEDNTFIYNSAGVVSTGGGILSHAGLIAVQFHKPSLIISGQWHQDAGGLHTLFYRTVEYTIKKKKIQGYSVCVRCNIHEPEYHIEEGDLVILDATEGRLQVLGQQRNALALYEGFNMLGKTNEMLSRITSEKDILNLRGKQLRARHQIEKTFKRLSDRALIRYAVYEILVGEKLFTHGPGQGGRYCLLKLLLDNPTIGNDVLNYLHEIITKLVQDYQALFKKAEKYIPSSHYLYEILSPRLDIHQLHQVLRSVVFSLKECRIEIPVPPLPDTSQIDQLTWHHLNKLRTEKNQTILSLGKIRKNISRIRHLLRQLERINKLLGIPEEKMKAFYDMIKFIGKEEKTIRQNLKNRYVIRHDEAGYELFPFIGWKAANLAEAERITRHDLIPPWFAVTNRAFCDMLDAPIKRTAVSNGKILHGPDTLRNAINEILKRTNLNNARKSIFIRNLWESVSLPDELSQAVTDAYRQIGYEISSNKDSGNNNTSPFVALRSSSLEEDAEIATRAGEFETFLYIQGGKYLLEYLKRTWSGLWTERAIHNRSVLGNSFRQTGGGVIIQCIVNSDVSGVLQTVNIARGEIGEIIINAGLGLGEGIVSGVVAADQITVSKEGDLQQNPLHFSYITSDKRERVVFNHSAGFGTVCTETLYHQRLRPALNYLELSKLVSVATKLEKAYGYPLDIEYGIESNRLWILQVRPVATYSSVLKETLDHYPISRGEINNNTIK